MTPGVSPRVFMTPGGTSDFAYIAIRRLERAFLAGRQRLVFPLIASTSAGTFRITVILPMAALAAERTVMIDLPGFSAVSRP